MSRMGDALIKHGPEGFDCNENDESMPAWVPQENDGASRAGRKRSYAEFLESKRRSVPDRGIVLTADDMHPSLFPFQKDIAAWAIRKGRAAIFADCGLGKSRMQLEWARHSADRSLIIAPLSVARQTVREGAAIDMDVRYVRHQSEVGNSGVYITNYEMIDQFDPALFEAVVIDESGILKHADSKTRQLLTHRFAETPAKLACTATPAPNDVAELCNHAEFLGVMTRREMFAAFFVHDEIGWRLKGHAAGPMYQWMAEWAVALRTPSDLGYDDTGYVLPELRIQSEVVDVTIRPDGQLFATDLGGIGGRSRVRHQTMDARVTRAAEIVDDGHQWIVWCGLNSEAELVTKMTDGAVNVYGSMRAEDKAQAFEDFQDGKIRVLVSKPSIAGFGMNFQQCSRMVFLGIGDSYEVYHQSIRRCYRFGQKEPVDVHIVVSALEQQIVANVQRKERAAFASTSEMISYSTLGKDRHVDAVPHERRPRRKLASTSWR